MKLGLIIKITDGGESELFSVNKDASWARSASDVRKAINGLPAFDGSSKFVLLAKFLGREGYLLTLIKARPGSGRAGDNTAAHIHVPAGCAISAEEMVSIIDKVKEQLSVKLRADFESLKITFSKEYAASTASNSAVGAIKSAENGKYAIRYYNADYTLKELLGPAIAQQEYSSYSGVFFIDKHDGIEKGFYEELKSPIRPIVTILPPMPDRGFSPFYYGAAGQPIEFNNPIEVPAGTTVTIAWRKNGYADIPKRFNAQIGTNFQEVVRINDMEIRRVIHRSDIHVYNSDRQYISNTEIRINDQRMTGECHYISEAEYNRGVKVSVSSQGYSNKTERFGQFPVDIVMTKEPYHFDVWSKQSGQKMRFTIDTKANLAPEQISDLQQAIEKSVSSTSGGNGGSNKLKYIIIGCCLLAFAILFVYVGWEVRAKYEAKRLAENTEITTDDGTEGNVDAYTDQPEEDQDLKNAKAYLNRQSTWNKDSLDTYNATRGLFEELNEFRDKDILKRQESLGDVPRFKDIVDAFAKSPGIDHHIGLERNNGKYCSDRDIRIQISNYIQWISTQHQPQADNQATVKTDTKKPQNKIADKPKEVKKAAKKSNERGGDI